MQSNPRMHPLARPYPSAALSAALVLLLIGATAAVAQPAGGDANRTEPATEQVIISNMPQHRNHLYSVLRRLLGKAKSEKLAHTQSEVWTVPKTHMGRFRQRLHLLGVKITHLRENWNHILRRDKKPMSPAQDKVLAKVRKSRETVGIGVMQAPEAAVAEYALMGNGRTPAAAGNVAPDDGVSRIVIPISDNQQITVARTEAVQTEMGVTWRGTLEETGESAVLMWWKDGRVTGVLGYKGHIFTVMNMGGETHAVIEVDPKKMPPDHATTSDNPARQDGQTQSPSVPVSLPAPSNVAPISPTQLQALEAKKIVIDVMLLYTTRAASHYMLNPDDTMHLAIEQANESFRNSGLGNISLRLVHTAGVTTGKVHDAKVMHRLIREDDRAVYGDKGYASDAKKRAAEGAGVLWAVKEKAKPGRELTKRQRARNPRFGKVRAKVEHIFRVPKCQFGYRKVRYRGLDKNGTQLFALFALANIFLARSRLASA